MILPEPSWLSELGPDADVVVTTRCRIARNVEGHRFPWRCGERESKEVADTILAAAQRGGGRLGGAEPIRGSDLSAEQRAQLLQWRYLSPNWDAGLPYRFLLVALDSTVSLLVNEEDHLRFQAILPGLRVESALDAAQNCELRIGRSVRFAWREQIGHLTASLSNAGTGLRISAFLHLVGLAASEARETILRAAEETGCAIRGIYGEGTEGTGELFQVSNRFTYGRDPGALADRVAGAARYLIEAERSARRQLFGGATGRARLKAATQDAWDRIFREELPPSRLLKMVSVLRLAVAEGVLQGSLPQTAEWIAIAGEETPPGAQSEQLFEAIRRTSAIRQRLRGGG